jgi:hypothetical protein
MNKHGLSQLRRPYWSLRRRSGFALFILLFFARPEISRDRVNRRLVGEFFVLCLVTDGTPKMSGDSLQYTERQRRLAFGKKVDLQIKMIAALEGRSAMF